jgi:hypothetical protein
MKHLLGAPLLGRLLTLLTNIRLGLEKPERDKHTSVLRTFVNYGPKKIYNIGTRVGACV